MYMYRGNRWNRDVSQISGALSALRCRITFCQASGRPAAGSVLHSEGPCNCTARAPVEIQGSYNRKLPPSQLSQA